jgi:hypothetical protein
LLLAGLLVWLVLSQHHTIGRPIAIVGAALLAYMSVVGLAISITGYYDWLRTGSPGTYSALDDATSWFPTVLTMITGHPDVVRIIVAEGPYPDSLGNTGTFDPGRSPFWLVSQYDQVDIISPANGTYNLDMHITAVSGIPEHRSLALVARFGTVREVVPLPKDRNWTAPVRLERGLNHVLLAISFRGEASVPQGYVTVGGLSLTDGGGRHSR